jgi:hypothetical protein
MSVVWMGVGGIAALVALVILVRHVSSGRVAAP